MQNEISGFWRRVGAFFIDAIILGLLGLLLGLFFSQQFAELGGWGRAIGFFIAAIYFVLFNSHFGNGQTIGKRALNIQVVNKDGSLINLPKSVARYSVLAVPYFLNGAQISENILYSFVGYALSLLVFGFGLSIIYLIIFNRNTRQSLHDSIVGTIVIRTNTETNSSLKPVWLLHYIICGILLISSLLVPFFTGKIAKNQFFSELFKTRNQIQNVSQVVYATIQDGTSTFHSVGEQKTTRYLSTQVFIKSENIEDKDLAEKIAKIILKTHNEAMQRNMIQVTLTYGYDIGISSFWKRHSFRFSPEELDNKTDAKI
jgi:uncharacterized RDD family membrane protein YckC